MDRVPRRLKNTKPFLYRKQKSHTHISYQMMFKRDRREFFTHRYTPYRYLLWMIKIFGKRKGGTRGLTYYGVKYKKSFV